jgi:hypothetical protein
MHVTRRLAVDIGRHTGQQIGGSHDNEKEDRHSDDDGGPTVPNPGTGTLAMMRSAIHPPPPRGAVRRSRSAAATEAGLRQNPAWT